MGSVRCWMLVLIAVVAVVVSRAETVATLPPPTGYVNDFAGVIDDVTKRQMEARCRSVALNAHAQIAVVTIRTLEGVPVQQFANELEEKWKVGSKGTDRGVLLLFAIEDRKRWVEVGYGLEGILNDAKVGDIGREMVPELQRGDYGPAVQLGVERIAQVIEADGTVAPPIRSGGVEQQAGWFSGVLWMLLPCGLVAALIVSRRRRRLRGGYGYMVSREPSPNWPSFGSSAFDDGSRREPGEGVGFSAGGSGADPASGGSSGDSGSSAPSSDFGGFDGGSSGGGGAGGDW